MCDFLGLKLAPEKAAPPCKDMESLGLNIDSDKMEVTFSKLNSLLASVTYTSRRP